MKASVLSSLSINASQVYGVAAMYLMNWLHILPEDLDQNIDEVSEIGHSWFSSSPGLHPSPTHTPFRPFPGTFSQGGPFGGEMVRISNMKKENS